VENSAAPFETLIYKGVGYGFLRGGEGSNASESNK